MRTLLALALLLLPGCSQIHYSRVETGQLKGKLLVQWVAPDEFIFVPHPTDPLTFKRANGDAITPGRMYTDGGSIPRFLWVLRSYSPWGYAPAFIVHDWLFDSHHCGDSPFPNYTNSDAAMVMSEIMKTMMEETGQPNAFVLYTMYEAVNSSIAQNLWDHGACKRPELLNAERRFMSSPVAPTYEIEWPPKPTPSPP
jgi:hypothetical protein